MNEYYNSPPVFYLFLWVNMKKPCNLKKLYLKGEATDSSRKKYIEK